MNSENGPGDRNGGSLRDTDKAFEKLLDRLLAKCDSTKNDLESLWRNQIISVGLSVAVVLGLGEIVADKLLNNKSYGYVLNYILPLVNLYFMMRFGFLTFAFSESRSAAEKLSKRFIEERHLAQYFTKNDEITSSQSLIHPGVLYSTNSFS